MWSWDVIGMFRIFFSSTTGTYTGILWQGTAHWSWCFSIRQASVKLFQNVDSPLRRVWIKDFIRVWKVWVEFGKIDHLHQDDPPSLTWNNTFQFAFAWNSDFCLDTCLESSVNIVFMLVIGEIWHVRLNAAIFYEIKVW